MVTAKNLKCRIQEMLQISDEEMEGHDIRNVLNQRLFD
jgi:hypothetical protein